jgi:5-deoxy-glucuronate isomerase
MNEQVQTSLDKMIFRKTNTQLGRRISVTPHNSTNKHLAYGRIILNANTPQAVFSTDDRETGLICLSGSAQVQTDSKKFRLSQYDALYIPRDSQIEVNAEPHTDLAEFSAEVSHGYPLQYVSYQSVSSDPTLHLKPGGPASTRDLSILIGKNVEAGRLLIGFTFSEPGNWTSWPPHEHAKMLEEMYVYFDMPEPAYGIQLVYNNTSYPELVIPVRDGDAVLIPSGYHPNVSLPGHRIAFLWAMAAHREVEDRQYGVVNVQPAFQRGGSGLEAGRK